MNPTDIRKYGMVSLHFA